MSGNAHQRRTARRARTAEILAAFGAAMRAISVAHDQSQFMKVLMKDYRPAPPALGSTQ